MIKRILFRNFYSFEEETEVSFEVGKKPTNSTYDLVSEDGSRINKVIGVIGPNGSGKTQLLKPLPFLAWFVSSSYKSSSPKDKVPLEAHKLGSDKSTYFEIEFIINGTSFRYHLEATREHVINESLYVKTSHLYSYLFIRELKGENYEYKHKGFDFQKNVAEKIRGNASIISAAHMYDSEEASKIVDFFESITSNINVMGREYYHEGALIESASFFKDFDNYHDIAKELICDFDLGLSSVELMEAIGTNEKGEEEKITLPVGVHKDGDKTFELPFFEESNGTKSTYVLLRKIIPVLENGGIAVLDEIDSDLHFHMMVKLIELFKHKHTNPNNAQLIFSCHSHEILNVFRKHQVILTEKESLYSEAWRLDEMKGLRADDNLYAKYQAGALGAVPNI
ncbi:ATP-binding protein [Endozoicomonas sp. 4G]|uniref:AAA family ATPase n=1 Tax=Endozoicomonas sp. 4G TaxID=2872754 RepID=UPI0020785923|nr:ATP-binding protein [Endozoicomonas sp. 4G]